MCGSPMFPIRLLLNVSIKVVFFIAIILLMLLLLIFYRYSVIGTISCKVINIVKYYTIAPKRKQHEHHRGPPHFVPETTLTTIVSNVMRKTWGFSVTFTVRLRNQYVLWIEFFFRRLNPASLLLSLPRLQVYYNYFFFIVVLLLAPRFNVTFMI
jgi:hypothetical protein